MQKPFVLVPVANSVVRTKGFRGKTLQRILILFPRTVAFFFVLFHYGARRDFFCPTAIIAAFFWHITLTSGVISV